MDDHLSALTTEIADRIGRTQASVAELQRRLPSVGVRVSSAGGEVVVSVNEQGRLMALQLESDLTDRVSCDALESLINNTLRVAVDLAGAHRATV